MDKKEHLALLQSVYLDLHPVLDRVIWARQTMPVDSFAFEQLAYAEKLLGDARSMVLAVHRVIEARGYGEGVAK